MRNKAFAAVAVSLCLSSTSFAARITEPQGVLYLKVPLGALSKQERFE